MIIPVNRQARMKRASTRFADAMSASTGLEEYILGDANGRINDPDDRMKYLVRRDIDAPLESFYFAGVGPVLMQPGARVLVGWHYDGRKIIGMSTSAMVAGGQTPGLLNLGDKRLYGYFSKEGLGEFKAMAVGTQANPSMVVIIAPRTWVDDTQTIQASRGTSIDLTGSVPSTDDTHRIAVISIKTDLTASVQVSTAISTVIDLKADVTYLQECLSSKPPRAIPVAAYRLYAGQTAITEADKLFDMRELINTVPPRMNWSATTNPTTMDDNTAGYGVGSRWANLTTDISWECVDDTEDAAVWVSVGGSANNGSLPLVINAGETFTLAANRQAYFFAGLTIAPGGVMNTEPSSVAEVY